MSIQKVSRKYDVFLGFRGEDTRNNFTSHLYTALNQRGINVFRDDKELERGKSISPELLRAIEESRFSVIVFSRNYAYSTWCLDELVKIVECKNTGMDRQMIFPIFYDVEPTVVRKQKKNFEEAFAKHEQDFKENIEKVQKWRDALKVMANISGWELKNRSESEFIEDIVMEISSKLIPTKFETHKQLVGIDCRSKKLRLLLDTGSNDVRMIGIWGMGGLGKTTIARAVYDLISPEFQASSFLANVREISEKGNLISLQKQLLSELLKLKHGSICNVYDGIDMLGSRLRRKKALVVIDDVVDVKQLENLAGNQDWFGSGSRIIITSRDKHLLKTHGVDEVYELEKLNFDEALLLFCIKAFKSHQPLKEYADLSKRVVEYAAGLPLAIEVLGSFLCDRTVQVWESALQILEREPADDIMQALQISFHGLKETEKKIFLDIACFFNGEDRDSVTKILDSCDFHSIVGIEVLVEKSLISVEKSRTPCLDHKYIVRMHDLLQEMGQQIVRRECPDEPGKRSRLWKEEDIHHVLTKNTGTEVVEAIILDEYFSKDKMHLSASANAFSRMTNLRLLKISDVQLPEGLDCLSNNLRLLEWHGYPLKFLPSKFLPEKIFELEMCRSNLKQLWQGIKPFNNLKSMRFTHSKNLRRTPDFTGVPNLERLILDSCRSLHEIHPSTLVHKKLILLSLKGCTSLTNLPSKIAMESLTQLVLSGCSKLREFPEIAGSMDCLFDLLLDETAIKELPLSVELLSGLESMNLEKCKKLKSLPSAINGLKSLKTLNLSGCSKLEKVPDNLGEIESLEYLDISGTAIRQLPSSISLLKNLEELSCRGCKGPPTSTSWFSAFRGRNSDPIGLMLPSLSGLCSLWKLDLSDCNLGEGAIPNDICNLLSLLALDLSKNNFVSLPGTINRLSELKCLKLEDCKWLQSLPELPSSTGNVRVDGCVSLETLSDALKSCNSGELLIDAVNCSKLVENNDLELSFLKVFLEAEPNQRGKFSIVFPGSKIPEWFRYQNEGSSMAIMCPPYSYYTKNSKKKLAGYVICSVFHVHKHSQTVRSYDSNRTHFLHYVRKRNVEGSPSIATSIDFDAHSGQAVSDHLWLYYWSNKEWYNTSSTHSFWPDFCSSRGLEVKSFGLHPVYVYEVEEFNETTKEWTTASKLCDFNESDDQVFVVGSKIDAATMTKRSLAEYAAAEASASDSEPQAKRFKQVNDYRAKTT